MFDEGLKGAPSTIHDLVKIRGSDRGWHDQLPNLYSFLAFCHHERLSLKEHEKLQVAMYEDVSWDGEPIAGMTADQSAAVQALRRSSRLRRVRRRLPGARSPLVLVRLQRLLTHASSG